MESPAFSSFRRLMDLWDASLVEEERESAVRSLIDGQGLILFFRRGGDIFGAPEESRMTFAKLKAPDEDDEFVGDDANFLALNLLDALSGRNTQNVFGAGDLPKLTVIDREECEKLLLKRGGKAKPVMSKVDQGDDDGLIRITGEK